MVPARPPTMSTWCPPALLEKLPLLALSAASCAITYWVQSRLSRGIGPGAMGNAAANGVDGLRGLFDQDGLAVRPGRGVSEGARTGVAGRRGLWIGPDCRRGRR